MKKLMFLTCILLVTTTSWSQPNLNVKIGISPGSRLAQYWILVNRNNPHEEFRFSTLQVRPQAYAGVSAQFQLRGLFFLETGITYTERTSLYRASYTMPDETNAAEQEMNETEKIIMLPANIGVRMGKIKVTSGLTAMKTITKAKELSHMRGFHQESNVIKVGWQMGARYSIGNASIGVEYQGTLSRIGQSMFVNKQSLALRCVPGNFVFSFQYSL